MKQRFSTTLSTNNRARAFAGNLTGENEMTDTTNTEIIKSSTGATRRPECTYYHANARGTGAALRLTLHPARPDYEGAIMATFAPQSAIGGMNDDGVRTFARFDWEHAVSVKLGRDDLAKMIEVFIGCEESVVDRGIFHHSKTATTVIKLRHCPEPVPGYLFEVFRRDLATCAESHVGILLSPSEALGLARAIEGAMVYVMFGMPNCL